MAAGRFLPWHQSFFDKLLSTIVFSPLLFYLCFYWWPKTFAEEPNKVRFFQSFFLIKFLKNGLKVFKERDLVLHLFLLKLRVTFDSALDCVDKNLEVTKIFKKKNLEIGQE